MSEPATALAHDISHAGFQQLAQFRYCIRQFVHFSEQAARAHGIEPQQYQLLLTIKGLPPETLPTVTVLSHRMCLRHHSTVELINRMEQRGAVVRRPSDRDRREVLIELTPQGEEILQKLALVHWQELQTSGPALSQALQAIVNRSFLNGDGGGMHG